MVLYCIMNMGLIPSLIARFFLISFADAYREFLIFCHNYLNSNTF